MVSTRALYAVRLPDLSAGPTKRSRPHKRVSGRPVRTSGVVGVPDAYLRHVHTEHERAGWETLTTGARRVGVAYTYFPRNVYGMIRIMSND